MLCLSQGIDDKCLQLLKKTQVILRQWASIELDSPFNQIKVQTLTLNNLGCYYKKVNKPYAALKHLNNALELEKFNFSEFPQTDALETEKSLSEHASTFLNICAICS